MKNIKKYLPLIILILVAAALIWLVAVRQKPTGMILFYGDTCPHCKIVEDYIAANNVRAKFKFQELEVYQNKDNAALLGRYAERCHIDLNQIGVPFFWDGQTCLVGEQDIIQYFQGTSPKK